MYVSDLSPSEYAPYAANYVEQAGDLALIEGLNASLSSASQFYSSLSEDQFNYSYAEGKWTIKELLLHIIDAERVFAYRALRIARKDMVNLLGFSENDFAINSNANNRSKDDLIEEYVSVRTATITLFNSFTDEMLLQVGKASDAPVSVRALGFIIIGHEAHHIRIVKERYI